MGELLVVSPHCDDGVFGCGQLLAAMPDAVVTTIFAGGLSTWDVVTRWDAASGFRAGDDVMAARRAEDRAALARLGAEPRWLDFLDAQYLAAREACADASVGRADASVEDGISAALDRVVRAVDPEIVAVPIGLFHSDHAKTHAAGTALARAHPARTWLAYEDAIYRRYAGLLGRRLAALRAAGVLGGPANGLPTGALLAKRRAVACYRSQLCALTGPGYPGFDDVFAPERYWRLAA